MLGNLIQDLRYGIRSLISRPMFALVAILTLALGIGANTSIFSVIHGMYLRPLPYPAGERLVNVYNTYPNMGLEFAGTSIPDYLDRREQAESLEDLTMFTGGSYNLAESGSRPERLNGIRATPSMFSTLQVAPVLGRAFTEADAVPGNDRVVVISHSMWTNRFNADPDIVGRDLRLNGESWRVLGVMREGFAFPGRDVDLWVPFAFTPEQRSDDERGNEYSSSVGRMRPGATVAGLNAELDTIVARNADRFASTEGGAGFAEFLRAGNFTGRAVTLRDQQVGSKRAMLVLLQAAVAMVLLIACANVANLMLTRIVAQRRDLSVRNALGATRWRIARQLLIEAMLLALVGGGFGLLLAYVCLDLMPLVGITSASPDYAFRIDAPVLLFAAAVALLAGLLAAILPLHSLLRLNINDVIKEGGRLGAGGRGAAASRSALVVTQIALATTLLIGAGLMLKSFHTLQEQSPGFSSEGVMTAMVTLPSAKYGEPAQQVRFYEETLRRLRELPGVSAAGYVQSLPFSGNNSQGSYNVEGVSAAPGQSSPHGFQRNIDEQYLDALSIPLLQGRQFSAADDADAPAVVIVDQLMAEKYFKGQDPIGKRITRDSLDPPEGEPAARWATIVGVVQSIKHSELREEVSKETIYWPMRQRPASAGALVVRTATPDAMVGPIRDTVLTVDPELPLYSVQSLDQRIALSLDTQRAPMLLLLVFAAVAMILSALGIYGVLAYSVTQRTSEFGVRMAIGAGRTQILSMILRHGAILTAIGLSIGLLSALLGGQAIRSQLFEVSVGDPTVYLLVVSFLAAVAMLSCYLPARRATRVDPLSALRYE